MDVVSKFKNRRRIVNFIIYIKMIKYLSDCLMYGEVISVTNFYKYCSNNYIACKAVFDIFLNFEYIKPTIKTKNNYRKNFYITKKGEKLIDSSIDLIKLL